MQIYIDKINSDKGKQIMRLLCVYPISLIGTRCKKKHNAAMRTFLAFQKKKISCYSLTLKANYVINLIPNKIRAGHRKDSVIMDNYF